MTSFTEELLIAEYQSLRSESEQARNAQQTILNWSMGALSVLVAAGASQLDKTEDMHPGIGVLFGVAIPAFLTAAALMWIGELARMERAGYFLRRWERLRWHSEGDGPRQGPIWENYLSFNPSSDPGKHWATYIGGTVMYGGGVVGSLLFFLAIHTQISRNHSSLTWLIGHPLLTAIVMFVLFSALCLWFGLPVALRGGKLPSEESLTPDQYLDRES